MPEVTDRTGDDLIDDSAVVFARVDARLSSRSTVTVEAFSFPARTRSFGLGPRRDVSAAVDLHSHDAFAGLIHRLVTTQLESLRFGSAPFRAWLMLRHTVADRCCSRRPARLGTGFLRSRGWPGASRPRRHGTVSFSLQVDPRGDGQRRRCSLNLSGRVDEQPIIVTNSAGAVVRSVTFGPATTFGSRDILAGVAVRDLWHASEQIQIEGGARVDDSRYGGGSPSGRTSVRYGLDSSGKTVIKAGLGTFVGALPLPLQPLETIQNESIAGSMPRAAISFIL